MIQSVESLIDTLAIGCLGLLLCVVVAIAMLFLKDRRK